MNEYKSVDTVSVIGRGIIKVLDKPNPRPKIDEVVCIDGIKYLVRGVEMFMKLPDPPIIGDRIGVVVREIK
jgi:translation elongation factor EF-Tu-like GTPase